MKKLQNQKTKPVTVKHVVTRASKDRDFKHSLLKAPAATLKKSALTLSGADGKKLNTLIAKYRRIMNSRSDLHKYGKQLGLESPCHEDEPPWDCHSIWGTP